MSLVQKSSPRSSRFEKDITKQLVAAYTIRCLSRSPRACINSPTATKSASHFTLLHTRLSPCHPRSIWRSLRPSTNFIVVASRDVTLAWIMSCLTAGEGSR